MGETVFIALIAVLGTALGAAISPVVDLISKAVSARTDDKSARIKAVAEFGLALRELAGRTRDNWDAHQVRFAYEAAVGHRFEVAKNIPRGAGRVDWFCEYAVEHINAYGNLDRRIAAADYASTQLLSWARGDRKAKDLHPFDLEPDGNGGLIVV